MAQQEKTAVKKGRRPKSYRGCTHCRYAISCLLVADSKERVERSVPRRDHLVHIVSRHIAPLHAQYSH